MSITGGSGGVKLILRIFKHLTVRPDANWVNTYEFVTNDAWSTGDLFTAATDFLTFERNFHSDFVSFDRWTFSTWVPDSTPYDPEAFTGAGYAAGTLGLVSTGGGAEQEPLDIVAWVERHVPTGRQGKLFYRGVLAEGMVQSQSGVPVIQGTALTTAFTAALPSAAAYFSPYAGDSFPPPLTLALIGKTGQVRHVSGLVLRGVAINKRDRGYFDRV